MSTSSWNAPTPTVSWSRLIARSWGIVVPHIRNSKTEFFFFLAALGFELRASHLWSGFESLHQPQKCLLNTVIDSILWHTNYSFFFFFYWYWGLNLGPHTCEAGALPFEPLRQPFFVRDFFWDSVSRTIYLGWFRTAILLISASWIELQVWATCTQLITLSLLYILFAKDETENF
jgi:hypothetical protein